MIPSWIITDNLMQFLHSVTVLKLSSGYTSICDISLQRCDLVYFVNVYLLSDFPV